MYDRLFISEQPGTTDKDFVEELNPNSLKKLLVLLRKIFMIIQFQHTNLKDMVFFISMMTLVKKI